MRKLVPVSSKCCLHYSSSSYANRDKLKGQDMSNVSYQNHSHLHLGKSPKPAPTLVATENDIAILDGIIAMAEALKTTKTQASWTLRRAKLILFVKNL